MIDFKTFEALEGKKPDRLLDRHPDGKYLAMQVPTADAYLAAIWNSETKRLTWSPEDAHALAWLRQGTQIAALQNPHVSEDFQFAIYSWPQGPLLQHCPLRFPMGYLFDLVISPTSDLAVCQWTDQCEFGYEFVAIHEEHITHLVQDSYSNGKTSYSTRPVFSSDGHLWVCAYQENTDWWENEDTLGHDGHLTRETKKEIGAIVVFHQTQILGEIPLRLPIPSRYQPPNVSAPGFFSQETKASHSFPEGSEYIVDPVFLDTQHMMIRLPSGESQVHDLSGFWGKSIS